MAKGKGNKPRGNFITELYKKFDGKLHYYYYFMWINKLTNIRTDFSDITEEDFIFKYCRRKINGVYNDGESSFKNLKMWESTEEFQGYMQELYSYKMNQDFYGLYEIYLAKAIEGDEKSLNALKIIKKEIESLNKANRVDKPKVIEETSYDMK